MVFGHLNDEFGIPSLYNNYGLSKKYQLTYPLSIVLFICLNKNKL